VSNSQGQELLAALLFKR